MFSVAISSIEKNKLALERNKQAMVAAHRSKDWETAAKLSAEKERLKRKMGRRCEVCDVRVWGDSRTCRMHTEHNLSMKARRWMNPMKTAALIMLSALSLTAAPQISVRTNAIPTVTLSWAHPTPDQVRSYELYMGDAPGRYTNMIPVTSTGATYLLPARGVTFYFMVLTIDTNGLATLPSNEISYTAPNPIAPAVINPIVVLAIKSKSDLKDFQWADTDMQWSVSPDDSRFFKLELVNVPPVGAAVMGISKQKPPLPPSP